MYEQQFVPIVANFGVITIYTYFLSAGILLTNKCCLNLFYFISEKVKVHFSLGLCFL